MCQPHYYAKWRGKNPEEYIPRDNTAEAMYEKKCWVESCPNRAETHSLCRNHARRARTGRIEVPPELGVVLNSPCSFEGCGRPYEAKSLCHSHLDQKIRGEELRPLRDYGKYIKGEHICMVKKCKKVAISRGLCQAHLRIVGVYKISLEKLHELMAVEKCENPGCTNTKRLHVDHDHATGEVRGMLCPGCNTSLGHLKEDVSRIRGLAEYKMRHS